MFRERVPMKMPAKILILGGYGNTGFLISKLLAQHTDSEIILGGRNLLKAENAAAKLNQTFNTSRVTAIKADASDKSSLITAFWDVDLVVVASSTIEYVHQVATAALDTETDYMDIHLSSPAKLETLNSLRETIVVKQRCFITDGGFHPGVPAAMVRYAAQKFNKLETANIWGSFQINWKELEFSDSTFTEFIDELQDFNPVVLKNGNWEKTSFKNFPRHNFGLPVGKRTCTPMYLEELRSLPKKFPNLKDTGFYIAGFNWMTDYIVMPLAFAGFNIFGDSAKEFLGKLFYWSLANFSRPPYQTVLQLEANGQSNREPKSLSLELSHDDAYALTAIPVVACLMQYLNQNIRKPGLWLQANLVEPVQFFHDIDRLGVEVNQSWSTK